MSYNGANGMRNINIRKIIYQARHRYLTLNNVVIAAALLIAFSWVWGSLGMMQRNYSLQKEVDMKQRQLELVQLQRANLELQKRYYQTTEYQELAVRESLGLVRPGEKVLILPENTQAAKDADKEQLAVAATPEQTGNIEQWVNFLFGGYSKSIERDE
jgi:cell division protein FtsB